MKFWRNPTGSELMSSFPSPLVNGEDFYVQGFTAGLGLGGYVFKREERKISLSGKLNYVISHAINGNLNSVGNILVEDGPLHIELGGQLVRKFLFIELSYEFGLSDAFTSRNEQFKYRLLNVNAGLYF